MAKPKKQSPKRFSLKREYQKSWNYIKDSGKFIKIIIWVFVLSALAGILIPPPESALNAITELIKKILLETENMGQGGLITYIFLNNVQSSFFGIIFGVFFGVLPLVSAFMNGYLLGFVADVAIKNGGIFSLWRIFPHGIFELPAVIISFALGLRLGAGLFSRKKLKKFNENFFSSLKAFALIVLPLLVIAAVIEGTLIFLMRSG